MRPRHSRRHRLARTLIVLVVVLAGAAVLTLHLRKRPAATPSPNDRAHRHHVSGTQGPSFPGLADWSLVATPSNAVKGIGNLVEPGSTVTAPATWTGLALSLRVLDRTSTWVRVELAPGSSAQGSVWIPTSTVTLERTPYRVVVELSTHRVLLLDAGRVEMCSLADIGAATTPTPPGEYFVVALARAPSAAFGPFVVLTSAVGANVTDWTQGGTPIITLSGPLGLPVTGAPATSGAVHLPTAALSKLGVVPDGTPVDIVTTLPVHNRGALDRRCEATGATAPGPAATTSTTPTTATTASG